ncbi:hypothetical protein NE664_11675 [Anaerotignum faecicola]|nr:hypothetical protein [Anaerotignum faecicola]
MKIFNFKWVTVITVLLALLFSSCNFTSNDNDSPSDLLPKEETGSSDGAVNTKGRNKKSDNGFSAEENSENSESGIEDENSVQVPNEDADKIDSNNSEKPNKPENVKPVPSPGISHTDDKDDNDKNNQSSSGQAVDPYLNDDSLMNIWKALDDIVYAGQTYYTENFSKTRVITHNGYLYNKAAEETITVDYLIANGYLSSKYVMQNYEVLLLNAADLKKYSSLYIKDSEEGFIVVAAAPHPSENMYLLTTANSAGGAISSSQYAALLNNYYQNHGAIGRLSPSSENYNRILNFISMYESKYEEYFVRSITTDNKYAVVILSGKSSPNEVRQYILRRSGNIWEVVMSGLETDPRVLVSVNKALPDFNLELLPPYTINDHLSSLNRDKSPLIGQMINMGFISGASDISYICGTSNFVYIVLNNEVKYLCSNTGDSWNIVQVSTSDEARNKMLAINKNAPTFIILDR